MRSGSLDYRPLCVKGNTGGRQNPSNSLFSVEVEGEKSSQSVHFGWHFSFYPPSGPSLSPLLSRAFSR